LGEAFEADKFNVRVANSLKVLRHLSDYATIQTPHFAVRYDAKNDAVLSRYMADALEREYDRLAATFQFRPAGPILIEVFNRHDMFSGRTVGLPDLHTIGACTGRMVAMVSPKGQGIRKPFNWGRVIRHELVHIFNLEQTNFQVPHWLTEGLAVRNEGFARSPEWLQLLAERAAADDLLNLNTINLGFMRPRSPAEWTLAYCQAQLYVEYLTKAHGETAVAGLLAAYRDGLDTPAALRRACGVEIPAFEAKYKEYVRGVVAQARGKPPEKPLTLAQLQEAVERSPDDLDLAARLAEQYWKRRRAAEARTLAERILQKQPKNGLALFVKAQLLLSAGEDEHAHQLLELAAALDPPEPKVLRALAKQHFDAARMDLAEALYRRGQQAEPNDPSWHEDLARVYKQTGDAPKRIAALEQLAPLDADDLPMRRELAERLADAGRWADAERWAREALEIDVEDSPARTVLFRALAALGKQPEADRLRKLLTDP
jgi:Flp pilus assembly protein TadD